MNLVIRQLKHFISRPRNKLAVEDLREVPILEGRSKETLLVAKYGDVDIRVAASLSPEAKIDGPAASDGPGACEWTQGLNNCGELAWKRQHACLTRGRGPSLHCRAVACAPCGGPFHR